MFREQLNTSFENIKPSPELLDRISAMMSEEVSRKKPAIQFRAAKYAGIAAALAVTAGATLLILNNNNGIKTADNMADVPTTAAVTASPETAAFMADAPAAGADNGFAYDAGADETVEFFTEEAAEDMADEAGENAEMFIMAAAPEDEDSIIMAAGDAIRKEEPMSEAAAEEAAVEEEAIEEAAAKSAPELAVAMAPEPSYAQDQVQAEEAPAVPDDASMSILSMIPAEDNSADSADMISATAEAADEEGSADYDGDDGDDDLLMPEEPEVFTEETASVTADNAVVRYEIIADDPEKLITDIPKSAQYGETIEIKTGVVMDADIIIYADGTPLERTHYDSDYWGYLFTMPDHDVTITVGFSSGKQE